MIHLCSSYLSSQQGHRASKCINKRKPNTNWNPLASVLCKSSGKPSTRFLLRFVYIFVVRQNKNFKKLCFRHFFEKWAALETQILWSSKSDVHTQLIHTYQINFWTIHFVIVWAIYLPSRVTGQEKVQISAGPNTNQYPLASVLLFENENFQLCELDILHPYHVNRAVNRQPEFRSRDT